MKHIRIHASGTPLLTKIGLLLLLLLTGCELADDVPLVAPEHPPVVTTDHYREKYCGTFLFTSYHWSHTMGNYYAGDTVSFLGTISTKVSVDSTIRIRYRTGSGTTICGPNTPWGALLTPKVTAAGILHYPIDPACHHGFFQGAFNRLDTIDVNVGTGTLAGPYGHRIHGVRVR